MERKPKQSFFTKGTNAKTKHRSKSDTPSNLLDALKLEENQQNILNYKKKNQKLAKLLEDSMKRNKEMLAQLRQKIALKEDLEVEKNTTKELQILVNVCEAEINEKSCL